MNLRHLICIVWLATMCGCQLSPAEKREADRQRIDQELGSEVSLKSDRTHLDDLRQEVPEVKKQANDELAMFLSLMVQGTESPSLVREKYQVLVLKQRTAFREKLQELRREFRNDETKRREEFLQGQKIARDRKLAKKKSDNHSFFQKEERRRTAFFEDERARRLNYESEINAKSKDFDSYMRERQKEFDEQYRLYSKKYSERPKAPKASTGD